MAVATGRDWADLEREEADIQERLADRRHRAPRLGLRAMHSQRARDEFAAMNNEIAQLLAALAGVEVRREQLERRDAEYRAEEPARAAARERVRAADVELVGAGRDVDAAFATACLSVQKWLSVSEQRGRDLKEAGGQPSSNAHAMRGIRLAGAWAHGMHGLPFGVLRPEGAVRPGDVAPLVANDEKGN